MKKLISFIFLSSAVIIIFSSFSTSAFACGWEMWIVADPIYLGARADSEQTSVITVYLSPYYYTIFSSGGRPVSFEDPIVGNLDPMKTTSEVATEWYGIATSTYTLPANIEPQEITITATATVFWPEYLEGPPWVARGEEYTTSESCKVYVIAGELEATDTNTTAEGIRKSTSKLVMVDTGTRTADITLLVNGTLPYGYPKWSNTNVTGTAGNLTATYSGTSDSNVECTVIENYVESLKIDIVRECKFEDSWDFNEKTLKAIKDALNNVIKKISKKDVDLETSGTLSVEFKRVDKYNDGNNYGYFAYIDGTVTATFPDVEFYSPYLPVPGLPTVKVAVGGGFSSSSMTFSGDTLYDESKANPGEVAGTLSASTTSEVDAKAKAAWVLNAELKGSATLSASGGISKTGKNINANYGVGVNDVALSGEVYIKAFGGEYGVWEGTHEFNWNASKSGTAKLYSFK